MNINSKQLMHNIQNNKFNHIYLFSGPEIGEKKEVIQLLEKKIFIDQEIVKYTYYCGADFNLSDFQNNLFAKQLFYPKKLIILKNIEEIDNKTVRVLADYILPYNLKADIFENQLIKNADEKTKKLFQSVFIKNDQLYQLDKKMTKKKQIEIIKKFNELKFSTIDSDTFLIMMNETNDKIPQGLQDLLLPHQKIMFWEMFESQKKEWLRQEFKKYSLLIDDEAIQFILNMVENNKEQLMNEVVKIAALFSEQQNDEKNSMINIKRIEEYLYHSKEETPFSLYSALLEKKIDQALDILEKLFFTDEYTLLNGIIWSHRRFTKALDLYENQNLPENEIFKLLKIFAKKNQQDFLNGFKNFHFSHICIMFDYLSELDYYLKILPPNLKMVKLQEFIIAFIKGDIKKSFLKGELQLVDI